MWKAHTVLSLRSLTRTIHTRAWLECVRVMLSQLIVVAISDLHWVKLLLLTLLALCTALRSLVRHSRHSHVIHTVM